MNYWDTGAAGLRDRQRRFAAAILADADAPVPPLGGIRAHGLSPERRLQVYRNNVFANLSAALAAVYPVLQRLLGDDFFQGAAQAYIRARPSSSGDMHDVGEGFPAFLAGFRGAAALPYLADVGHLEWACHQVFHAACAVRLDLAALAEVPARSYDTLRLELHPASRLLASRYPILRIWQVNQATVEAVPLIDLDCDGDRLLVIRPALEVELEPLAAGEFALLQRLAEGRPVIEACEAACAVQPDFDLAACLRHHIRRGTLVGFST